MTDNERATIGDNRAQFTKDTKAQLRAYVERIERLQDERDVMSVDIKEVYGEVKGVGFDVKIVRKIIARRKRDRDKLREEDEMLELYEAALGVFG